MSKKLYIAMYHYTRDLVNSRYPKIKGLDLPLFRQQLDYFEANFHVILQDLLKKMDDYRGVEYDYPANEELLEQYAVASRLDCKETISVKRILQTVLPEELRHQIASELFEKYLGLPEDKFARELYMNHDQIRFMKTAGMFIGFHGYGEFVGITKYIGGNYNEIII